MGNLFDEFREDMNGVSDELIKAIRADFAAELGDSSKSLGKLVKKIENDKHSDLGDVSRFSAECGQALARAIAKNVTPEVQADFAFTYEVANRILQSTLHDNYELIDAAAAAVQERLDAQQNIHIAPQKADFPEKRIEHIAYAAADKTASPDTLRRRLDSPVRNVTESFYTDYVKENAELRSQAGLTAFVVRQTNGRCCDWCAALAGRYEYPDVPEGIWGFHDNCTCTVLYSSAKTTSVHSRKNRPGRRLEGKERERAISDAAKPTRFTKEQAENLQYNVLNGVANSGESGIINISGAISGALDPDSEKAQEHADKYYEAVRHMTNDVNRISQNTGFSLELIESIKRFVFLDEHELDGEIRRFDPSFEMAQSWQRLIEGKNIQPHDITLLNHEKMERELMKQGYSQDEAHQITSVKYNYAREAKEFYGKTERNKKNR